MVIDREDAGGRPAADGDLRLQQRRAASGAGRRREPHGAAPAGSRLDALEALDALEGRHAALEAPPGWRTAVQMLRLDAPGALGLVGDGSAVDALACALQLERDLPSPTGVAGSGSSKWGLAEARTCTLRSGLAQSQQAKRSRRQISRRCAAGKPPSCAIALFRHSADSWHVDDQRGASQGPAWHAANQVRTSRKSFAPPVPALQAAPPLSQPPHGTPKFVPRRRHHQRRPLRRRRRRSDERGSMTNKEIHQQVKYVRRMHTLVLSIVRSRLAASVHRCQC